MWNSTGASKRHHNVLRVCCVTGAVTRTDAKGVHGKGFLKIIDKKIDMLLVHAYDDP